MMKKIVLLSATVALCLCVLTACGQSAIVGTWYQTDMKTGEQTTLIFDKDGTGIEGTTAFKWKEDNGTYTLTSGTTALQITIADDAITYTESNGKEAVYYRDQARSQQMYETARQERVDAANAEKESTIKKLSEQLVGSYGLTNPNVITKESNVIFNADGTFANHEIALHYEGSSTEPQEITTDSSGTWEIAYEGAADDEFADEHCSQGCFKLKYLKEDGSEFASNEISDAVWVNVDANGAKVEIRYPYEKKN